MESLLFIVACFAVAVVLYVYIGYPLVLWILTRVLSAKDVNKKEFLPRVTLIISCYNEEGVIEAKLDNSLAIDYPRDLFEIIVVSDGSTDRTDEITQEYKEQGIRLIRQEGRLGKTMGLNMAVPEATGEIIIFSDANALYQHDAVKEMVMNFADDQVGYVVGEAQYDLQAGPSAATVSENSYWDYEICIKKIESRLHSVVGGDGAIYAIRKELYEELRQTDINDFVNPLQIIAKGYRGIYEPRAIAREDAAGSYDKEFGRKYRIVNRAFSGLMRVREVMNPFRTGIFSFQIVSHKLLRWLVPFFLLIALISSIGSFLLGNNQALVFILAGVILSVLAGIGWLGQAYQSNWPTVVYLPYYFAVVNFAAFLGILKSLRGDVQVTWETVRDEGEKQSSQNRTVYYFLCAGLVGIFSLSGIMWFYYGLLEATAFVFWLHCAVIVYVYLGYPVILYICSRFSKKEIRQGELFPSLSLLISAYNEEEIIRDKIENSLLLDYPVDKIRIVLVSDGSTDKTNEIFDEFDDERIEIYKYEERSGKIGALLRTIPAIQSEIILFSDANAMYAPDSVQKIVRNFADPDVGCVSGEVVLQNETTSFGQSENRYYTYERCIQRWETRTGSTVGADGAMYAIRRELFVMPSWDTILDDFVISMNVALQGYRVIYESEAKAHEPNMVSHRAEFIRKSRIVAGAVKAIRSSQGVPSCRQPYLLFCYISHKVLRWLVPLFLLVLLTLNFVLHTTFGGTYTFLLVAQLIFYLAALTGCVLRKTVVGKIFSMPFYFCLVNFGAMYGLYKGVFNKQKVRWETFR